MLSREYEGKMAVARQNFADKAYERALQEMYALDPCHCGNEQVLWMFALEEYEPGAPVNTITERQLHGLFCRMDVTGSIEVEGPPPVIIPTPPVTFLAEWAWMATDPYPGILVADNIVYNGSSNFVTGANIFADLRPAPSNSYNVIRYPLSEPAKSQWYNDIFNYGTLPDSNYREALEMHGYRYIVSRLALTLNPAELTKFF